ncbi:hypothetical protein DPMN_031968 [Dreissena polymorpha]|uniref:Uncharacterized protein n=1 Tax=Dreissena polymorpha TaxID=45954 RepID=A0A9D4RHT3_DREPO|nr:hypothetical protein DPMN_031968 [Dreissena polymorpha]
MKLLSSILQKLWQNVKVGANKPKDRQTNRQTGQKQYAHHYSVYLRPTMTNQASGMREGVCMHSRSTYTHERSTLARECLREHKTPRSRGDPGTYDLWIVKPFANLLREESETVDLQIRLIRRKKYKLTTTDLLRIISHINALGPSTAVHHMLDDDEFLTM